MVAWNSWESKASNSIVSHGRCGTFCPVFESGVNNISLHKIDKLSCARQPEITRPTDYLG